MHTSSMENMQKCYLKYINASDIEKQKQVVVLDVGGIDINGSYKSIFGKKNFIYLSTDIQEGHGVSIVIKDPNKIPLDDASIDIVISGQTFEHCEFFWMIFTEMVRVLKPDGFIFLIAPSAGPIHRYPVDCYRFYPDAYHALAKYTNCKLIDTWLDDREPWRDLVGVFQRHGIDVLKAADESPSDYKPSLPYPSHPPLKERESYATISCLVPPLLSGEGLGGAGERLRFDYLRDYLRLLADAPNEPAHIPDDLAALFRTCVAATPPAEQDYSNYNAWLQRHRWDDLACRHLLELTQHQATLPLIHWLIVLPASQSALLGSTLISLAQQTLAAWRLTVIADFACPSPEFAQMDELSWIRLNSWEELSNALADQARQSPAEWFWCGYPGIQLEPVFINLAVELISRHPEWRFVYTDEDVVGQRLDQEYWSRPQFKPDANLDLLRSSGYIGHASLVHRELWESLPSVELRPGLLLNYAAALRCFEQFGEAAVGHIDEMVFHQPETAPVDWPAFARDALPLLSGHLQRQNLAATVNAGSLPGTFRVNYRLTQTPLVSIIIPTRNRLDLIQSCLDSLLARTRYPHFEVLIVDNRSDEPAVLDYLQQQTRQDARVRVIPYPDEYNYSAINNHAAQLAQGEFLLLLNNDTVILRDDWLATLVAIGLRPDVGAVGGRLIYPDHSVQHAGIIVGLGGVADHIGVGLPLGKSGYMGRAQLNQNFSAATAACLLVRRQVFFEVGGLDERDFAVLFNDVDFCLKLGTRGYRIVWSPSVTLIHHGSSTLQSEVDIQRLAHTRREQFALIEKWRARLIHDPAYNRHLSLRHRNWRLDEAMDALWHPEFDPLSRVVALPCDDAGVGHYRVSGPIGELTRHARIRSLLLPDGQSPRRFMPEPIELSRIKAQVLLLQNAFTDWQLPALKVYAQLNPDLFKVFGLDDLVFALPANHPARQYLGKDIKTRLRQGLAGCDRAVVTSEPIAEALRGLIADIRVMPNYLERSRWAGLHVPRQEHRKPRVGWAGGIHHAGDLALLQPVIEATAAEVDWVFMGLCLDAARPWVAEVHPGTPFDAYPAALAALDLDLAVAPLEHHRFNRAKSNLRLLEYGVLGWPVVCTDILPYQNAPVTRTPNNPDAWIKAIREHIHNPEASIAMGAELQTWVLTHWMLDQHLDDWLNALLPEATLMRNPT